MICMGPTLKFLGVPARRWRVRLLLVILLTPVLAGCYPVNPALVQDLAGDEADTSVYECGIALPGRITTVAFPLGIKQSEAGEVQLLGQSCDCVDAKVELVPDGRGAAIWVLVLVVDRTQESLTPGLNSVAVALRFAVDGSEALRKTANFIL